jgi:hypothetical protein
MENLVKRSWNLIGLSMLQWSERSVWAFRGEVLPHDYRKPEGIFQGVLGLFCSVQRHFDCLEPGTNAGAAASAGQLVSVSTAGKAEAGIASGGQ